ncbi:hypothetical protein JCM5353_005305, partial [Sporobolomyces roseus]
MSYPPPNPYSNQYSNYPPSSGVGLPSLPSNSSLPYPSQPVYSHLSPVPQHTQPQPHIRIVGSFAGSQSNSNPSPQFNHFNNSPSLSDSFQPQYPSNQLPLPPSQPNQYYSQPPFVPQQYVPQSGGANFNEDMSSSSARPRRSTSRVQSYNLNAAQPQVQSPPYQSNQSVYSTRRSSARPTRGASQISYAEPGMNDDEEEEEEEEVRRENGNQSAPVDIVNNLPPLPSNQNGQAIGEYQVTEGGEEEDEEEPVGGRKRRITQKSAVQDSEDDQDAPGEMDTSTINPAQLQNDPYHLSPIGGEGVGNGAGGVEEESEGEEGAVRPRRAATKVKIADDEDEDFEENSSGEVEYRRPTRVMKTASGRTTRRPDYYDEGNEDEEDDKPRGGRLTRGSSRKNGGYRGEDIVEDEEEWADDGQDDDDEFGSGTRRTRNGGRNTRTSNRRSSRTSTTRNLRNRSQPSRSSTRQTRNSRKAQDTSYDEGEGHESFVESDEDLSLDLHDEEDDDDLSIGGSKPRRNLRQKKKVDYFAPLSLEAPAGRKDKKRPYNKKRNDDGNPFNGLPANLTGAQWAALYPDGGQPSDSSDDDMPNLNSPSKSALFTSKAGGVNGGMLASGGGLEFGSGAPNNLGKVGSAAALADTDPLGVPSTISFDSVGGLGSHIQQLKEMVSLPLLYPEVFERFAITPPRGVLFHGPPGTGKTLLARALAASCSTDGRKISFFMRKGADCLSKWVGEAERQLRLLFEEAKNCQPSIIFFDEIDGLAPVRSSKQEQIHASIVSTLLALMDGMDGRGQVIVIGATNRPDAIDPALRRPGRFDREFYFPLPNIEARKKIMGIHTKGWNPPLEDSFMDELADLTKGYGGADLRALCTEAALNAVQRTYPQIYKTNDRLLIKPETIEVTARDFVISQKNLIPSSHRSTSTAASALPPQLVPVLADSFEVAKAALAKVLPEVKRPNILEEAEFVDDGGGFEKEKMLQAFETLRVFRPRLLILGEAGSGQGFVGSAVLHHLEGFHVQTLDLATLVSDSSRTMEAACVQLFVEAKRHKPSILFIPSLLTWCTSVGETVRSTIKGLLDSLDPSDPILLLAVVEGSIKDIPSDVRSWFGFVKGNRVVMGKPSAEQREAFFADVIAGIARPPNEFPDAMPRRKRILEKLPIAPPPPPREPTAAEIAAAEANDQRLLEYLKWKLGPVLGELKKRYKRFTRNLYDDWREDDLEWRKNQLNDNETVTGLGTQPYHNVDLDQMHSDLYKGIYRTPDEFLTDILRIQANAEVNKIMEQDAEAPIKAGQMVNHTKVMLDQTFDANFRSECSKMAERMREKEKDQPKKERKGKGRDLPGEGIVAAAKQAAIDGGLL